MERLGEWVAIIGEEVKVRWNNRGAYVSGRLVKRLLNKDGEQPAWPIVVYNVQK